ncbi:unnamed protein product [Lactuca virosa]|uniref:Uncharacterized protein n=1 Tax=Lactuca virosa TaxID=75947 RepID=A0AAU9MLL0_9ASTR|nr:unnamed protein product [Lactuca virosa]
MDSSPSNFDPRKTSQSTIPKTQEDDEFWPLSGKPYFYVVLNKLHLATRFQMTFPRRLSEKLPAAMVSAKIVYRGKVWDLVYIGDQVGDVCLFDLMEGSVHGGIVKFKVQILRDNFPSELVEKAEGHNMNNPIDIE